MTIFRNISCSPLDNRPQYDTNYTTWTSIDNNSCERRELYLYPSHDIFIFIFMVCSSIVGLLGNGTVIYLLGFHIKKSPFTTYILNLAVSDFGVLLFGSLRWILLLTVCGFSLLYQTMAISASFMYVASQLLLTAISIDRCVSVLFPIWYRCHRPTYWSTAVCALIWVLTFLPSASSVILYSLECFAIGRNFFSYPFIVSPFLCLPLVTVSTVSLWFKMFRKSQQPQRGRLLTIILLTLLFFLIFAFPLSAIRTIEHFSKAKYHSPPSIWGCLCAFLNSCDLLRGWKKEEGSKKGEPDGHTPKGFQRGRRKEALQLRQSRDTSIKAKCLLQLQ